MKNFIDTILYLYACAAYKNSSSTQQKINLDLYIMIGIDKLSFYFNIWSHINYVYFIIELIYFAYMPQHFVLSQKSGCHAYKYNFRWNNRRAPIIRASALVCAMICVHCSYMRIYQNHSSAYTFIVSNDGKLPIYVHIIKCCILCGFHRVAAAYWRVKLSTKFHIIIKASIAQAHPVQ